MSLLAPKTPPPCKCGTKLFPKMAEEYPVDPNRLKLWEATPSASFGAEAASQPTVNLDTSGMKSPLMFFLTLGAGLLLGFGVGYTQAK